jgi:hypothetical protein
MSELLGADTRSLDLIAEELGGHSQDIQDLRTMAQRAVAELCDAWGGSDFELFAWRWEHEAGPRLAHMSLALSTMATTLRAQAEAQRQASGDTGGSSVSVGTGGPSWGSEIEIEDLDPDDIDAKLPTVSEHSEGGTTTRHGKLGPVETLTIGATSGNRTDTRSSTFINGQQVGTEQNLRIDVIGQPGPEATLVDGVKDNVKLNLAQGDVGVDASLVSKEGGNGNVQYQLSALEAEAKADYSVDVDAHGNLAASAGASTAVYAGYAAGRVQAGNDTAKIGADGKAYVGAEVEAKASGSIGPDGAKGHLGAEAFAGGRVQVNASGTVAGVTATAGAEISYGIGAHAHVDAEFSATNVGVAVDIGATLGVGAGVKFDVGVRPQDVVANVGNVGENVGDAVASFFDW